MNIPESKENEEISKKEEVENKENQEIDEKKESGDTDYKDRKKEYNRRYYQKRRERQSSAKEKDSAIMTKIERDEELENLKSATSRHAAALERFEKTTKRIEEIEKLLKNHGDYISSKQRKKQNKSSTNDMNSIYRAKLEKLGYGFE